ncbi:3-phosphoglycerate kinase [Leuconostoc holzapfelii]|uniref:3-phosphoglycerate kinase n=1 Tax=Leuconostoc holzapfelii TaxID=434464 RepID=A0ABT2NVH9_9LACO|nr:zinc ABC transporter substrate-binding protein [Leuconostoc holzapfelii]MCT8389369.1 3-phosphoglycerate kinase [Leuconostoc holzapfelii]
MKNKQALYAILTLLLIPIGLCLIIVKLTVPLPTPKHAPVKIVTDYVAYQQIAQDIVGSDGHVQLLSGQLPTRQQRQQFKQAEVVLTDSHDSSLLTQRQKFQLRSKVLIASDGVKPQSATHYWLSPQVTLQSVTRLSDLLSDFDPQNRDFYIKQSQALLDKMKPLADGIAHLQAEKNVQYLATNHAQDLFMTQLGYQTAQADIESATDANFDALAQKMQDHTIRFILNASQDASPNDQRLLQLANDHHIPIITFNQILPTDQKVWDWQLSFVTQLQAALKPTEGEN